jgi:uncharacterized RDD family membrane protein YckC
MAKKGETPPSPAPEPELTPRQTSPADVGPAWQSELAERLQNYRRRRSQSERERGDSGILNLDFPDEDDSSEIEGKVLEFPLPEEKPNVELGEPAPLDRKTPAVDALQLEEPCEGSGNISAAAVQAGEVMLDREALKREPVEIVVEAPGLFPQAGADEAEYLPLSPALLKQRFVAGLLDALVLLLGATLFALIFWRSGGHLTLGTFNLTVLVSIAVFFVLTYFGVFTALASSTPGLLWMGLEVRNFRGERPSPGESFWRAFGYLVSMAALMQGFVWALVDSEGLTWHDRMSGTLCVSMAP